MTPARPAPARPTRVTRGRATRLSAWRVPITAVAVVGLGTLVAVAVLVNLYLGLSAAAQNTRDLLQSRATSLVDELEARLDATLDPVLEQGRWIAGRFAGGDLRLLDLDTLDAFMAGALSATPQVPTIGLVDPKALLRRWSRADGAAVWEDWSTRPDVAAWLAALRGQPGPSWRRPSWTHTTGTTAVTHETPLRQDGRFVGVLLQVVPIETLSRELARLQRESGMTPFVLHERDRVLAHPLLAAWSPPPAARESPLPRVDALGDDALTRLATPDEVPVFLRGMQNLGAGGAVIDGRYRVFLHRDIARYGPGTWTVGVHFDAETEAGGVTRRLDLAVEAGLALCALAIGVAVLMGRRLSRPVQLLARAAAAVRRGELDAVPALPASRVRELDTALESFRQMVDGLRERQLIRDVLGRFVPESVARSLLTGGGTLPAEHAEATLLFCDLAGFTRLTERIGADGVMTLLNEYFEAMVEVLERHGGIVTQFQGDAILATFNVPLADPDHAENALRAALEMRRVVRTRRFVGETLTCRIGVNTGDVVAGAVGAKGRLSYTVHGDAVNLAARLEALNKEHGTTVLVSGETASRVHGFRLRPVGEVTVRGQSRPVQVYELEGEEAPPVPGAR